ncbi:SDR family oxidoreductase [Mangrovimicrobium sediminis]|uniref:SDR family oxidoreductase n=1 Tax=Mangrovimicrobium sediminis TaxID=2562682 RepID=A0A4Z0M7W5_9GAMM|nr:SDR family oxidoreductase [Haliea sp. SAOS-164]TGD75487.1 SDR family oxidoreductase [Haliea sp. SAOS-164]
MSNTLSGKTALVTGGARGLGKGMVERLAEAGALVIFNYATSTAAAEAVVAAVEARGGQAVAIQAALTDDASITAFAAAVLATLEEKTGSRELDILVNNIGGGVYGGIATTTPEVYDHTFNNNVRITFFLTQALMPHLREGGRVINISSAASRLAGKDFVVYSMSKAALDMFTKVLAKELGPRGIPVNSVCPGFNATDANEHEMNDEAIRKQIEDNTLLGRFGQPEDIAAIVYALASPDGRWVTGQVIEASGGFNFLS